MPRLKAAQRREQLIAVATRLFADAGYEATTTAAIAQAAGVTEPILYRHFENKQDLFIAIVQAVSAQTMEHWRQVVSDLTEPDEIIRRIAREFPNHIRKLADAYHVIHGALATTRDPRVLAVMREHYQHIEAFFVGIVIKGQRSGKFRDEMDPRVPAWQLINTGIGYAMISLNLTRFGQGLISQGVEFILRGMLADRDEQPGPARDQGK